MNNIIILTFLICLLSVFIPIYMYKTSNILIKTKLQSEKYMVEILFAIMLILNAISMALVITSKIYNNIYWIALFIIISAQLINFSILYEIFYMKQEICSQIFFTYLILLSLQLFASYAVNPLSGIILAPVLISYLKIF